MGMLRLTLLKEKVCLNVQVASAFVPTLCLQLQVWEYAACWCFKRVGGLIYLALSTLDPGVCMYGAGLLKSRSVHMVWLVIAKVQALFVLNLLKALLGGDLR